MASITINTGFVPNGTTFSAYPSANWPAEGKPPKVGTAPVGAATTTGVSASGQVTFSGLADNTHYYAYDATSTRYTGFRTDAVSTAGSVPVLSDLGTLGSTATLSVASANYLRATLGANVTLTFPSGSAAEFTLDLKQDATGSRLVTWPASVKWDDDVAPTLTTTPARRDVFSFRSADGTTWDGFVVALNRG